MQPYNSTYDGDARGYDLLRDCWLNQRRERFIAAWLAGCALPDGALVVEIGSGTGRLLNGLGVRFPHLRFAGIEPIPGYVEYARRQAPPNIAYQQAPLDDVQSFAGSPRAILSNDVLHHLPSYEGALHAVAGFASEDCRWLAIEPNCKNLYTFVKQAIGYGERNFWPRRFRHAAEGEGWTLRSKGHLFLIPPSFREAAHWMQALEHRLEAVPFLAGGVYLELEKAAAVGPRSRRQSLAAAI
ncbi:MAG TPA: class I SAM-dependent methyltransferase [Bryobacteraceae bacterium]|jgi:SAM-dependent methyltransferase